MKTFQKMVLLGALASLSSACFETRGSIATDSIGTYSKNLSESGAAVDFLRGMEGSYDVVYKVYNGGPSSADIFQGAVEYQWDSRLHALVGSHDSQWGPIRFQSSLLLAYDETPSAYAMGWAAPDGSMLEPLQSVENMGFSQELSVPRSNEGQTTRTVMMLEDNNVHTIRRFVSDSEGCEELVLEMICTRM